MNLKKICEIPSPCGQEDKACFYFENNLKGQFDDFSVDALKNIVFHKNGSGKKVLIECGIDEPGIMLTAADGKKERMAIIGGIKPERLFDKKVIFTDEETDIIRTDCDIKKNAKEIDLFIPYREKMKTGDFAALAPDFSESSNTIMANNLEYKLPAFIIANAIQKLDTNNDIYVLLSTQKCLGGRGIKAFLPMHKFDYVLTVNTIDSDENNITPGKGAVVVLKDLKSVLSTQFKEVLPNTKYQFAISKEDYYIKQMYMSGTAAVIGCICCPINFKGKPYQTTLKSNIYATSELIASVINNL